MTEAELYSSLKTVFHEPSRLAVVAALAAAGEEGLSFPELGKQTELTCGNLSRHIKHLMDAGAVAQNKRFVGSRPRTDVTLTDAGREAFAEYLASLERALKAAETALQGVPDGVAPARA